MKYTKPTWCVLGTSLVSTDGRWRIDYMPRPGHVNVDWWRVVDTHPGAYPRYQTGDYDKVVNAKIAVTHLVRHEALKNGGH